MWLIYNEKSVLVSLDPQCTASVWYRHCCQILRKSMSLVRFSAGNNVQEIQTAESWTAASRAAVSHVGQDALIFTARCYAERGDATSRLSVRLSVRNVYRYCNHIGWSSSKIISRRIAKGLCLWFIFVRKLWSLQCGDNTSVIRRGAVPHRLFSDLLICVSLKISLTCEHKAQDCNNGTVLKGAWGQGHVNHWWLMRRDHRTRSTSF